MSAQHVHVRIGAANVLSSEGVLFAVGLGSCVAVALCDPDRRICGLAHVMLPGPGNGKDENSGRYAATAVVALVAQMLEAGAQRSAIFARIVGGAAMFEAILPASGEHLGLRNVAAVKAVLAQESIPLRAEEVGGTHGRSVFLDAQDGSLTIRSVHRADVVI